MLEAYGNEQQAKTPNILDPSNGVRTFRNFAGEMRWYDLMQSHDSTIVSWSQTPSRQPHCAFMLHVTHSNNNNSQAFQLIVLARYLLGVPKP